MTGLPEPPAAEQRPAHEDLIGELARKLNRPLTIGSRTIAKRLVLAPLSKLGNVAFRELVAEYGGFGLLFSEMAGARAISRGGGRTDAGFVWRPEELPWLVCQIFGDDPQDMAAAAARVAEEGFFGVDINFGCAVASVCRANCGAELLKTPDLAENIVAAVRNAVAIPVTVKFRTGWRDDPDAAVRLARGFEAAGADALTFHPRVAPDRRTRPPKWEYIGRVKAAVGIPVFGNGNVFHAADCLRMLTETGCDGVAIGRLAAARPWIFAQWTEGFTPPEDFYGKAAHRLLDLLTDRFAPTVALRRFYKFAPYFAANFKFGHTFYRAVHQAKDIEALRRSLTAFFATPPEVTERLNLAIMR